MAAGVKIFSLAPNYKRGWSSKLQVRFVGGILGPKFCVESCIGNLSERGPAEHPAMNFTK